MSIDILNEWKGQISAKFTTQKAHIPAPEQKIDGHHPLFNVNQRKHFSNKNSDEYKWVSSSQAVPFQDRHDRFQGRLSFPEIKFKEVKLHFERRH